MILQTSLRVSSVLSAAADLAAGGRQGAEAEPGPAPGRGRGPEAQHHHVPVREQGTLLPSTMYQYHKSTAEAFLVSWS